MMALCRCKGALTAGDHTVGDSQGPSKPQLFAASRGKAVGDSMSSLRLVWKAETLVTLTVPNATVKDF